jgi:hypothetical protein
MGFTPSAAAQLMEQQRQQPGPLQIYAQAQQIRGAQTEEQLRQTELQQRQLQLQDTQATTAAMKEWDGKNPDDLPPLVLKHGGSSTAVFGLKNQILDWKTKAANLTKDQLDNLNKTNDIITGHLESVKGATDKNAAYASAMQDLQQKGLVQQGQLPDQYPGDDWLDRIEKEHMGGKAIVEQAQKQKEIEQKGQQLDIQTKEFQAKMPGGAQENPEQKFLRIDAAQKQGQQLSDADKAFLQSYQKNKTMVPAFNFNLSGGATGGLDQAAIDQQAEKYYQTGQLPPSGRGPAGVMLGRTIMQRASELHPGASLAEGSAEYAANKESLKKLQSNLDSVTAFEKTANKNLDMFTSLAQKAINTGVPLLNAPLREGAKLLAGSENQLALDAARQVAVNEIAKVTSNPGLVGQLSDTARKEVEAFIPANATYGQALRVAQVLKQDMANRHQSYQEQIGDIQKRIGGGGGDGNAKVLTQAQIAQAAKDHNVSVEEATRQAKQQGYTVQ